MFVFKENEVENYLDVEAEDLVVSNLIDKHDIPTDESFLYNVADDYNALIDHISELYVDNKTIPNDIIEQLETNLNFKAFILIAVKEKMHNILSDNTTIVFKEIVTIVNLLSFGQKYDVFESYNFYNLENLALLFREYENRLKDLKDINEQDFLITFNQYTILIETVNELCTINATDVLRKKTINPIIDVITETINLLKYNIDLEEEQINTLNNILGKLLFYYSHIPFINTMNKDANYLIDEFKFNFEKLASGYQLSKNTNFAEDKDEQTYYKIYLNSLSTLICTLIYKLESTYSYSDYSIEMFEDIIDLYKEEIKHTDTNKEFKNIEELKNELLKNYLYIYNENSNSEDIDSLINEFIENPDFNGSNMYILHSIILFSSHIEDEKLLKVLEILISLDKFKNDYHEFYKLNICDVIINKFVYDQNLNIPINILKDIIQYVKKNKIASHLMSIYSKIYLSISLYYSYKEEYKLIELSKLYYFNYVTINGKDLLENEYAKINKDILFNHGKRQIDDMALENVLVSDVKCIQLGTKLLNNFFEQQEINLKYIINQKLSNIVTEIFTDVGLSDDLLNTHIENFISIDIFHGLTFVSIDGLCEHKCRLIDLGYEKIEIPLFGKYKLKMAYSNVYKHIFENIFEKNEEFIKQNIINLIISYLKSIPIYNDPITSLHNIDKLQIDLTKKDESEMLFIEFYIEGMFNINRKIGYVKTNKLLKEYAKEVSSLVDIYRLTGPKFGFILDLNEDYKSFVEKIKNIEMHINDEKIKPSLTFSVTWGNRDNILDKSSYAMNLAQSKDEKYYEFK